MHFHARSCPETPLICGTRIRHAGGPPAIVAIIRHADLMTQRYAYKVVELREKLIGGKISGEKLENILNQKTAQGWQLTRR